MELETVKLRQILLNFILFSLLCGVSFSQGTKKDGISSKFAASDATINCTSLILGTAAFSVTPEYPNEAKSAKIGGSVKVTVQIDKSGKVSKVLNADGHKLLVKSATEAARRVRFTPTLCDTKPVPIVGVVTYNFSPFVFSDSYFTAQRIEDFPDVKSDSKYYEPIFSLVENYRLAFGLLDRKFHVNSPLTKGEFAHSLRMTLDLVSDRAVLSKKDPVKIGLYKSFNPEEIKSVSEIQDFRNDQPYSKSLEILLSKYDITLTNRGKIFRARIPVTQNEIIDFWTQIFGSDSVPINFKKLQGNDRVFTRGEFALFLHESLYVLTYKVLP